MYVKSTWGFGGYTVFFIDLIYVLLLFLLFSADLVSSQRLPSCLPAFQRVQKAAKIKKKAVCNAQGIRKRLRPCSFHCLTFFCFIALVLVCVSSPVLCLAYVKIVAQSSTIFLPVFLKASLVLCVQLSVWVLAFFQTMHPIGENYKIVIYSSLHFSLN